MNKIFLALLMSIGLSACSIEDTNIEQKNEDSTIVDEQQEQEQQEGEQEEGPVIESAMLMNVTAGEIIDSDLQNDVTININGGAEIAVQFNVPTTCESILMRVNETNERPEESFPFCSGGDNGECLGDAVLTSIDGLVTVDAQCFSEAGQTGNAGPLFSKTFTLTPVSFWHATEFTASPSFSGTAPLNDVSLSCSAEGSATGDINWSYRCDEGDAWTSSELQIDPGQGKITQVFNKVCSYPSSGTYTPSCSSERAGIKVEKSTTVSVENHTAIIPIEGAQCGCEGLLCEGNSVSYTRDAQTISFEFSCDGGTCLCGQFANEWDFWVAPKSPGQVITITQMTPAQTGSGSSLRNGAEVNPSSRSAQGFNGHKGPDTSVTKFPSYSEALTMTLPYTYDSSVESNPDVIVKTISSDDSTCANNSSRICLHYADTLTLLPSAPTESVFRPPYIGDIKPALIPVSTFDDSILQSLATVDSSPSWEDALSAVQSVHLEHTENWNQRQSMHSDINHGGVGKGYEAAVVNKLSQSLLKLHEEAIGSTSQVLKRHLALSTAQRGIDLYAIHISDTPCFRGWPATGGFGGGKLGPILIAANLLGQMDWLSEMNAALGGGAESDDRNCFAETGYVRPAQGIGKDIPLFGQRPGGYAGSSCANGTNQNCASGYGIGAFDGLTDGDRTGSSGIPTTYQACCTHGYLLTEAMALSLSPEIMANMPSAVSPFLIYIERARRLGIENGKEFGAYNNTSNFNSIGYDAAGYDSDYVYDMWNAYK